jgi:quinol monooxygenase YgiN
MISLTIQLSIDPARVDDFLQAMEANAAASRREPGCRRFEIHRRSDRPCEFVLWELYDDPAALDAHHRSRHFERWKEQSVGLVLHKESIRAELVSPLQGK